MPTKSSLREKRTTAISPKRLRGLLCFGLIFVFFVLISKKSNSNIIIKEDNRILPGNKPSWSKNKQSHDLSNLSFYYQQATSERNSSFPLISGDTFRAFSTYIFDETRQDSLSHLQNGDLVFLKNDMLRKFFRENFDSIKNKFVLISHNSDFSAPAEYSEYLKKSNIIHWFASNPSLKDHPKLTPIPIGLANSRWHHGNVDVLLHAYKQYRKPWSQRTTLLYINFDLSTNPTQRQNALTVAKTNIKENLQIISKKVSQDTYLEQVGNAKFVLSPPGNGLDCHRTWEALLMGAAPIVLTSPLDQLFINTPVVILSDWSHLTSDLLLSLNFSAYDNHLVDVLTGSFWAKMILSYSLESKDRLKI